MKAGKKFRTIPKKFTVKTIAARSDGDGSSLAAIILSGPSW
jgi:hypothetical protein